MGLALGLLVGLGGCGDDGTTHGSGTGPLPALPALVEPTSGSTLNTDTPFFTVRNASGFDAGQADYTFWVVVSSTDRHVASLTVPAGRSTTSVQFPGPLVRGATLAWFVTAVSTSGLETASSRGTFRLPPIECGLSEGPWARTVEGFWGPATCQNIYNNPQDAIGAPNAGGSGPYDFFGFVSLGNGGWVDVDMVGCTVDDAGDDIRVYQSVGSEEVTLWASSNPDGPWVLVDYRQRCGQRSPGLFSRHCDFDLADAGLEAARYFRVQDGELFPCPGDTVSEGADIDAVEILSPAP
jgi:hypothetical protein